MGLEEFQDDLKFQNDGVITWRANLRAKIIRNYI
jgi:hypothetical protein